MSRRRIAVFALAGALVVGGAGAAVAAVTKDDNKVEQAILDDAAKRLNVSPQQLRDALSAAQDAQIDQAVKDGLLTQKQADAIKANRKASGHVLGGPPLGGPGMHGKHELFGGGRLGVVQGPREMLDTAAKALGMSTAKLESELRAGKSVAQIAKAQGKSLADVKAAVTSAAKTKLDKAVADGDVTRKQADEILDRLDEMVDKLATAKAGRLFGHRGPAFGHGGPGMIFDDLAKALGITTAKLTSELRDGKSVAAIAKAQGKSLSDVKATLKSAEKARLDKAVADDDLTQAQADEILEHFDEMFDALASGRKLRFHHRGGKPPIGPPPGVPGDIRPGGFAPDEVPAPPVIAGGTFN